MSAEDEEAAGKDGDYDLFSKLYTYEECMEALAKKKPVPAAASKPKPSHWPDDTEVDSGTWIFWLPDGWGQGIKTTISGKTLKCYIGPPPEGKRFFHKKDIEKYIGRELPSKPPPEPKEETEKVVRDIHSTVPPWPKDFDLPKDWRVAWRRLPTTLHKIYVPPGQDEGFLYQGYQARNWVEGKTMKLSPFGSSKPMTQIIADAASSGQDGVAKKSKKRKHDDDSQSSQRDGEHFPLRLTRSEGQKSKDDAWAEPRDADGAAKAFRKFHALLLCRGFQGSIEFVSVWGAPESCGFASQLHGVYFSLPYADPPAYQKLHCVADMLSCDRVYIRHSAKDGQWQICTMLRSDAPVYAYCKDVDAKETSLQLLSGKWMVAQGPDASQTEWQELDGLKVVCEVVTAEA